MFGEVIEFLRKTNFITEPPKLLAKSNADLFLESLIENFTQETVPFNVLLALILKRIIRDWLHPSGHDWGRLCSSSYSTTSTSFIPQVLWLQLGRTAYAQASPYCLCWWVIKGTSEVAGLILCFGVSSVTNPSRMRYAESLMVRIVDSSHGKIHIGRLPWRQAGSASPRLLRSSCSVSENRDNCI